MSVAGIATGVLAESHLGLPTKIEGNPEHPASLGATDAVMQASVLTLYDPDRSQTVTRNGSISGWRSFITALTGAREESAPRKGLGIRILTGTVTSPTLATQIQNFLTEFPAAKWHQFDPCGRHSARAGAMAAFGMPLNTTYRFDRADVIVSLDSDFLYTTVSGNLRYTRDYSARRRAAAENPSVTPPRLYVLENAPSVTGGMADHRFRTTAVGVAGFAADLARGRTGAASAEVQAALKDLESHRGSGIVIAGEHQLPQVPHSRACDQSNARQYGQDRHLYRSHRSESDRRDLFYRRSGQRHERRRRLAHHTDRDGRPQSLQQQMVHTRRDDRPLLALRRHRLDLPVSASVLNRHTR